LKKNIIIISPGQFGSHNGTYQYCILLSKEYHVTYFGYNENKALMNHIKNVNIIHLERRGNSSLSKFYFLKCLRQHIKSNYYDYKMINYFLGCSVLNLFIKNKIFVDIRSGYIYKNSLKRFIYNSILLFEVSTFKNITVISKNLANHLSLPKRAHHIPLGSPIFPDWEKKYDSFKILYVGTFHQRNLDEAIRGFFKFYIEFKDLVQMEMNIIGRGDFSDVQKVKDTISELKMNHIINFLGSICYPELTKHFEYNNIGLSYVPMSKYFNFQPPTKTFEYLSSGMVTIATSTAENMIVINQSNGVLILDNEESLFNGLKFLYQNRNKYNSSDIQTTSRQFSWNNIVYNILIPYLNNID
jgi:hypothetical protein